MSLLLLFTQSAADPAGASQRGMIAAKMVNMRIGDNQHAQSEGPPKGGPSHKPLISRAKAAAVMAVGTTTAPAFGRPAS